MEEFCVNFYAAGRELRDGKTSESEYFETFYEIKSRTKDLSQIWGKSVNVYFSGERDMSGYYDFENQYFEWVK